MYLPEASCVWPGRHLGNAPRGHACSPESVPLPPGGQPTGGRGTRFQIPASLLTGFLNLTQLLSLWESQFPQIPPPKAGVTLNTLPQTCPNENLMAFRSVWAVVGKALGLKTNRRKALRLEAATARLQGVPGKPEAGGHCPVRKLRDQELESHRGSRSPLVSVSGHTLLLPLQPSSAVKHGDPTAPESLGHVWGALRYLHAVSSP